MIRKTLITLACILGAILIFFAFSILPIKRYKYQEQSFYKIMMDRLDSLTENPLDKNGNQFSIGYAKVNLTPPQRTATAGYGNRKGKLYTSVHDSIFVRAMVISNGTNRIAIVSADLLIIPPSVTNRLRTTLPDGFTLDNTYLGAIHSHNSIGNWGAGVVGLMYGKYDENIVNFIAEKIKDAILIASKNSLPAVVKTANIPLGKSVYNRLNGEGKVDSLLHVVEIIRNDSSKLILLNYTAHATCLYSRNLELSRDYPGKLVDELEMKGYDFAMFMAGAVGSHGCQVPEGGWNCVDLMAETIVAKLESNKLALMPLKDSTLMMRRVLLELGKPQVKISRDWCIRPWLFKAAFGESLNYITALRIGELILLGTPCDYSGELTNGIYSTAKEKGLQVMVTSFNGGYMGYVTPIQYYDSSHYETRLMNWYGPGTGEYMAECLDKMIETVSID